jgi:hypothetical protein
VQAREFHFGSDARERNLRSGANALLSISAQSHTVLFDHPSGHRLEGANPETGHIAFQVPDLEKNRSLLRRSI